MLRIRSKYTTILVSVLIAFALPVSAQDDDLPTHHEWPVPVFSTSASGVRIVLPESKENGGANFLEYQYDWNMEEIGQNPISGSLRTAYPQTYTPYVINDIGREYDKVTLTQTAKYFEKSLKRFHTVSGATKLSFETFTDIPYKVADYISMSDFVNGRAMLMTGGKVEPKNKENPKHRYTYTTVEQVPDSQDLRVVGQESLILSHPRSTDLYPLFDADSSKYGATDGFIMLHRRASHEKKKNQNPDETLYEIVYINKDGKKVFDGSFNFGKKRRKLNETIFYKSGNNVVMTAEDWSSPESMGSVIFDMQGNETSRTIFIRSRDLYENIMKRYQNTHVSYVPYSEYSTPNVDDVRKDEKGNIYIFGQQRTREHGLFIAKINPDFTFGKMNWFNGWTSVSNTGRTRVIPLKVTDGEVIALAQMSTDRGMVKMIKASDDDYLRVSKPLGDGWGLFAKLQTIKFD